jgi:hypothetical protein
MSLFTEIYIYEILRETESGKRVQRQLFPIQKPVTNPNIQYH